ncbi:hypothetical protein SAMN04487983_100721 [Streptomyces sp. yr375]|uniref:proline-rich domain-containing protein n=1 Tax=Streptomyces sp. yr375 TaxID=1761906 RepID=UPI0008CA7CCB|nr:proline-rich domain-containing protein [Streptomyces sp. yr375]SEQ66460.1 hypothetical protein SAMN04487983_100721 [Streptomyces sp. yr375]
MTVESTEAGQLGRYLRLFDPGQRLGWIYRDPESLRRPFTEPEPQREQVAVGYENRAAAARLDHEDRRRSALRIGGGVAAVCFLLSYFVGAVMVVLGVVAVVVGLARMALAARQVSSAGGALAAEQGSLEQRFQSSWQMWHQHRQYHESQQEQWVRGLDAWGTLPIGPDTRRLDVFGGSQRGREGFLTVLGTSTLQERPVIVVDLTQALVCRELSVLAEAAGVPVDVQVLPSRMAESSIVGGLAPHELVHALVEAVHGDNPEAGRAERAVDTRILTQLCGALGEDVSLARLGAGLRVLMGEADDTGCLSRDERNRIADDLLNDKNKDQVRDSLFRLVSFVHPLERLGTAREGRGPGYLTCLALDFGAGSASTELLADLAVQSVMRRLSSFQETAPSVLVALGEQGLQRRHLEQLAQVCERRGSQLVLMHPHLRDAAEQMIGGGTVAFMKLGNHQEARVAADFIGREHSFVLHSLTDTEGRTVNTSVAKTIGSSVSRGTTHSASVTRGTNWGSSSSSSYQGGANPFSSSSSTSSGGSYSETTGTSTSVTYSTNESTTHTTGDSDSTSLATGRQRVYEYVLEPTQLQALAEFSLLVVERRTGGSVLVHPVDCNPNIVFLDRVSMTPLPHFDPAPTPQLPAPQHPYPEAPQQPYAPTPPQQPYAPAAAQQGYPPASHQPYAPGVQPTAPQQPHWPSQDHPQQPGGGWTQGPPPNWPGQQPGGFR